MEKPIFVKAKCWKTGRYYGLEAKQYSGMWKVDLSDSEAAVEQDSI